MTNYPIRNLARQLCLTPWGAVTLLFALSSAVMAQTLVQVRSDIERLKKVPFEELFNLEITTVSRQPERLVDAPSAIQVITDEEIRRSGASSLPEVLRLASNLQVAQIDSSRWT